MTDLRRPPRLLLVALLAVALLVGGCGLSTDDEPDLIALDEVPAELLEPEVVTSTTAGTTPVTVYLIERTEAGARLVPARRTADDASRPGPRIEALLAPTTAAEQRRGYTSSIPAGTSLLSAPELDARTGVLTLDVSDDLFGIEGTELVLAFAQLVYTATELESVERVRFLVEGEPERALDARGVEQAGAVGREDYASLVADR